MKPIISICLALSSMQAAATDFTDAGYLKDNAKNRLFTVRMHAKTTAEKAIEYANNKPHTPGRITAVYFYPPKSIVPADGVTFARSLIRANAVIYDTVGLSAWRYSYVKHRNGSSSFVDCEADRTNALCRQ